MNQLESLLINSIKDNSSKIEALNASEEKVASDADDEWLVKPDLPTWVRIFSQGVFIHQIHHKL